MRVRLVGRKNNRGGDKMKLGKETKVKYCNFDVTFEDKEFKMLKDYGLKEIQKDDSALVNYAVNKILEKYVSGEKEFKRKK